MCQNKFLITNMNVVGSCSHMKASSWDEFDHLLITVHLTTASGTKM